ncbi:pentatricopeptide repeat-containing protein At2g33680-like [Mangifera indica]|uniref:pentatricopeptide repeat-containing protein At2g33680-like n=1 Tax=Mangifera indica TaxID=29780 RepID=UPI001CFA127B|nr:pentatricopeptide repeat-containing protein At2g33680-like [Mangifera indica]
MLNLLFPANFLLWPLKSYEYFPQLNTKLPSNKNFPQYTKQFCSISSVSSCEQIALHDDWPQLLKISVGSETLQLGQTVHAFLLKSGSQDHTFQANNLVNLYSKFKKLDDAQRVFDETLERNTITWTSLIKGYLENGDYESVFRIALDMCRLDEKFNQHTCSVVLQACSSKNDRILGEQIHGFVIKNGFEKNVFVATSLISMYSRSGFFDDAEKIFHSLVYKDVRCLNLMILEYDKAGYADKAFEVFVHLLTCGLEPNDYTFTNIISLCCENVGFEEGKQLHGVAIKYSLDRKVSVGNALVTMYGKCGMVDEAERMFNTVNGRNLISWTALMSGYLKSGLGGKAINLFLELLDHGIFCDSSSLVTVIDACSECRNLEFGLQLHGFVIKLGHLGDASIGTGLVDLYAKCGNLKSARMLFDGVSGKNAALFNALLVGFMETNGANEEDAMLLFSQQRLAGMRPDNVTFSRLISQSANKSCLVRGSSLHGYSIKSGYETDLIVGNALISMYAKCGSIEDAYQMFKGMSGHNVVSWNAILSAYALHGQGKKALLLFKEMKHEGFIPDEITVLAVLQACIYSGLWEDGICLFNEIEPIYGIKPILEHFNCMVDLLGRAGLLSEAMNLVKSSPYPHSPLLWRTLVSVSKLTGDLSFSILASKHLLNLEPEEAGSYILVSNMYAREGMLDEAAKVRTAMNDLKLSKEAGCSWIEINNTVHWFIASSKDHPRSREIYANLDLLSDEMKSKFDY